MLGSTEQAFTPSILSIATVSFPKGGGSLSGLDSLVPNSDMNGCAQLTIPLPITPARYLTPRLDLRYQSSQGNTPFGLGFDVNLSQIRRRTNKGVPLYNERDVFIGPEGEWLVPETKKNKISKMHRGVRYQGRRFYSHQQSQLNHLEYWQSEKQDHSYWLLKEVNGTQHLFGWSARTCIFDPENPQYLLSWLLEESWDAHGEHCCYHYKNENKQGISEDDYLEQTREHRAQRYLKKISYANRASALDSFVFSSSQPKPEWLLEVVLDYGEHCAVSPVSKQIPSYTEKRAWLKRADSFSDYASGFEIRTHRLCRQILMFHHFSELATSPQLVKGMQLNYQETPLLSQLQSVQMFGYATDVQNTNYIECLPPIEFNYTTFTSETNPSHFEKAPLPDNFYQESYQLVDLYGEGIPGILYQEQNNYFYRAPQRATEKNAPKVAESKDTIAYECAWSLIDPIPSSGLHRDQQVTLMDITGDGQLDCVVTYAGLNGFFSLNKNKKFQSFIPFTAFPTEFLHPQSQLIDMMGAGLSDLVLVGPNSVRIYPSQRQQGFGYIHEKIYSGPGTLPTLRNSEKELVAFSNLLSSSQHLLRITAQQIICWPHLGHGHFAVPIKWATLPFCEDEFDPRRLYLADLDGSGVTDIIYAYSDHLQIFPNHCGNGLGKAFDLAFPAGVVYDALTQLSFDDIYGRGTPCLILTVTHPTIQHWIYDFSRGIKPYLLQAIKNNYGMVTRLEFRSSSQEWLDEKQENPSTRSSLPFPIHVLTRLEQEDEIKGNLWLQTKRYRQAYYDQIEREFNGFGLVISHDIEMTNAKPKSAPLSPPLCVKTWYFTGKPIDDSDLASYYQGDVQAKTLGRTLCVDKNDHVLTLSSRQQRELDNSLRGSMRRQETYSLDDSEQATHPYEVSELRYKVRLVENGVPYHAWMIGILEKLHYRYERLPNDPQCQHEITLAQDSYGFIKRQLSIYYPRRAPASGPHAYQDPQQFSLRCNENEISWIHLDTAQHWRLGLTAEEKTWKYLVKAPQLIEKEFQSAAIFSYEELNASQHWLRSCKYTDLGQWIRYYYLDPNNDSRTVLNLGQATYHGLLSHTETVDISSEQLSKLISVYGNAEKLKKLLIEKGKYLFTETYYWIASAKVSYYPLTQFFQLKKHRNLFDGETYYQYDTYHFKIVKSTDAVGNITKIGYDYRHLQPQQIIDCNENTRAVAFDTLGRVIISTFYGNTLQYDLNTQAWQTILLGFAKVDTAKVYRHSLTLAQALENPKAAIQSWAEVYYYDNFSWMQTKLTPTHYLRLTQDRYPNDAECQIRQQLSSIDGLGRILANKQRADPGTALKNTEPSITIESAIRWLINEQKEYNNKGGVLKEYHAYFLESHQELTKAALEKLPYATLHTYDSLGRIIKTTNAQGYFRRVQYFPWYQIDEDENDTWSEVMAEVSTRQKA